MVPTTVQPSKSNKKLTVGVGKPPSYHRLASLQSTTFASVPPPPFAALRHCPLMSLPSTAAYHFPFPSPSPSSSSLNLHASLCFRCACLHANEQITVRPRMRPHMIETHTTTLRTTPTKSRTRCGQRAGIKSMTTQWLRWQAQTRKHCMMLVPRKSSPLGSHLGRPGRAC